MDRIYIALVDTPGIFAYFIRRTIGLSYVHVALSLDIHFEEAYSVGRRNPCIPFFAGFEREEKEKICRAFPTAKYQIYSLPCESWQKEQIKKTLRECYASRFSYHYCLVGLPFLICKKSFYQKNFYTCSSFVAKLLEDNGIHLFEKHFSLVTPRDFYEVPEKEVLFEGPLKELMTSDWIEPVRQEAAYEA